MYTKCICLDFGLEVKGMSGWRYWAVPLTFLGGLVLGIIWDIADGSDDVPPWVEDASLGCD